MSAFPGSPRLMRGAIVAMPALVPVPNVIVFQYNPSRLTRKVQARMAGGGGAKAEVLRLTGAPEETVKLDVSVDVTDQLEAGSPQAATLGIHPQLAALEMLLYPPSQTVVQNTLQASQGMLEIVPVEAPMTLLIWGAGRVLPVKLSGLGIAEEAHDAALNPIRAKVDMELRVLSYTDLDPTHPGYHLFLAHQRVKEALSLLGTLSSAAEVTGAY